MPVCLADGEHQPASVMLVHRAEMAGALAQLTELAQVKGADMAEGGGGFVLDRHGDHYLMAGDTEGLADHGAATVGAHVLQKVDDADSVGPAIWHWDPRSIAHQGAHLQPARG